MTKPEDTIDKLARAVAEVTRLRVAQQDPAPAVEIARAEFERAKEALDGFQARVKQLDLAVGAAGVELGAYE